MSYRPITDVWILARPKVKYYGAYPSGFLGRARALLGVTLTDPLLHVCGGSAKLYPAASGPGLGPHDCTLDIDAETKPDIVWDVREKLPLPSYEGDKPWPAILADPPYTEADSAKYRVDALPSANDLLKKCLAAVRPGGRVGMLHYVWPQPPREGVRSIACIGVIVGFNNRMRVYSVFEKTDHDA